MSTLYRERSNFERALLLELKSRLKGSPWKLKSCALYKANGALYQDIFLSVHRNAAATVGVHRIKPMTLDPLLWEILGIPENVDEPLSFRTWGAFTCAGLPLAEVSLESAGHSAQAVAEATRSLCGSADERAEQQLHAAPFSSLVAAHPDQVERGAYAVTLVTSLIAEGSLELAAREAHAYASGAKQTCANLSSEGKSFHELALGWLESARASGAAVRASAGA